MEGHRQQGHSMFENMRTNHLQVGHEICPLGFFSDAQKIGFYPVIFVTFCFLSAPDANCHVGTCEFSVAAFGGRAAEGESNIRPRPWGAAEQRLGTRFC